MSKTKLQKKSGSVKVDHKKKHKQALRKALEIMNKEKGLKASPFRSRLSFIPLINFWKQKLNSEHEGDVFLAKQIVKRLDSAMEFLSPISDESVLDKHEDLIDMMLMGIISPTVREHAIMQFTSPFGVQGFYYTKSFSDMILHSKSKISLERDGDYFQSVSILRSCLCILNAFYGQDLELIDPIVYSTTLQKEKGYAQFFKFKLNAEFVDIKKLKPLQPLSQSQINNLISNFYDLELWLDYIPPENFEFHGVEIREMVDITQEESISRLKRILLEKDAITSPERIRELEGYLRSYFQMGDLRLGITAIDYPPEKRVVHKYKIHHNILAGTVENLLNLDYGTTIYSQACETQKFMIIEDLEAYPQPDPLRSKLIEQGVKSLIIIPLLNKQDKIIGLLEMASSTSYSINSFVMLKMMDILPLFRTAIRRSREEIDNQIEALIRENYTALHPSIEWKFIDESFRMLEEQSEGIQNPKPGEIVFPDVIPLYGQSDIVSSSTLRNNAIQADLSENLQEVRKLLFQIQSEIYYPVIGPLLIQLEEIKSSFAGGISPVEELRAISFLQGEVQPLFEGLYEEYPKLRYSIQRYLDSLNPELGMVYRKRKDYEQSVTRLNENIASFLEKEQRKAQAIVPHYFEKYQTDGVEYEMYAGKSMLRSHLFSKVHLQNLRLWQLITMCEITRLVEQVSPTLALPLTTAQLILVHSVPLSIRFHLDEKKFDVDGAYNARYAILKKRIDKSYVNGTTERLTLSGKIAIVYSHEEDYQEYLRYLNYLRKEGYIKENIEDLTLNPLQGVQGLKALRITVKH